MPRVKRGTSKVKKRNEILSQTKGFRFARKAKKRAAYEAINHAGNNAFADRRRKKSTFRQSWHIAISSGLSRIGSELSYSKFIAALNAKNIELDRKIIADIAKSDEASFKSIVGAVA